jgi:membrane fusion protein (multidrug efflux system)
MNTATLSASATESPRAGLTAASLPQPAQTIHTPRFEINGEAGAPAPAPEKSCRPSFKQAALIALAAVAGFGAARFAYDWRTAGRFTQTTDDAFVGGDVTVIAPKVAGFISQLAVTDNQQVHAGDLLLKLDDRDYRAALAKADAAVSLAQAALINLDATRNLQDAVIAQTQAGVVAADAETTRTHDDQVRAKNLLAANIDSTQEFQQADAAYKSAAANSDKARAAVAAAQRQIEVIATQKQQAQAALDSAIAERDLAQLNLSYTEVRSPIDGVVGNRSAQVGAYATVGSQLISIVPAHGLWIDANYKEDQLARMHAGSPATVQIDLLGGKKFNGHVVSIAPATGAQFSVLPAENATGNFTKIVQRVAVRILLDDESMAPGALRPGLSATARVNTKS